MELCHSLRHLFTPCRGEVMPIAEVRKYINETLERDYTEEQVIIGMDYAGFERSDGGYRVEFREEAGRDSAKTNNAHSAF